MFDYLRGDTVDSACHEIIGAVKAWRRGHASSRVDAANPPADTSSPIAFCPSPTTRVFILGAQLHERQTFADLSIAATIDELIKTSGLDDTIHIDLLLSIIAAFDTDNDDAATLITLPFRVDYTCPHCSAIQSYTDAEPCIQTEVDQADVWDHHLDLHETTCPSCFYPVTMRPTLSTPLPPFVVVIYTSPDAQVPLDEGLSIGTHDYMPQLALWEDERGGLSLWRRGHVQPEEPIQMVAYSYEVIRTPPSTSHRAKKKTRAAAPDGWSEEDEAMVEGLAKSLAEWATSRTEQGLVECAEGSAALRLRVRGYLLYQGEEWDKGSRMCVPNDKLKGSKWQVTDAKARLAGTCAWPECRIDMRAEHGHFSPDMVSTLLYDMSARSTHTMLPFPLIDCPPRMPLTRRPNELGDRLVALRHPAPPLMARSSVALYWKLIATVWSLGLRG